MIEHNRSSGASVWRCIIDAFSRFGGLVRSHWLATLCLLAVLSVSGVALAFALGLVLGSAGRDSEKYPFPIVDNLADKIRAKMSMHTVITPAKTGEIKIATTSVALVGRTVQLPPATRVGTGGGMTSAKGHIVVITHDGSVFFVTPNRDVLEPKIELPDNGFADYFQISKTPPHNAYEFDTYNFRYNDVEYIEYGGRSGFIISYTDFDLDAVCYRNKVSIAYFDGSFANPESIQISQDDWTDFYQTEPCLPLKASRKGISGNLAGGRIAVDRKNGRIYYTSGEYGWTADSVDPETNLPLSQDPNADYGKLIAINLGSGESQTLALGLRNMQGIAFDRQGRIWTVEHGPRGGDELNLIELGGNFGWPLETYGSEYNGLRVESAISLGRHDHYTRPKYAWLPSVGTSGLTLIDGFHEAWDGDLLVSTLTTHKLMRIRVAEDRVVFAEDIKLGLGRRIRYVLQHSDGTIAILTDDRQVIFFSPVEGGMAAEFALRFIENEMDAGTVLKQSVKTALEGCAQCHALDRGNNTNAPSLGEVFGAHVASTTFEGYSDALRNAQGDIWTRECLEAFIADPDAVYPGTFMPDPQLKDPDVRNALIDVLQALSPSEMVQQ